MLASKRLEQGRFAWPTVRDGVMNEDAKVHDGRRAWRLLMSNPDDVADWRANGGPVAHEPPPLPLRTQTVADLEAARWNLLTWEAPWLNKHAAPFWAGVPMLEGRALDVEEITEHALFPSWSGRAGRRSGGCGFETEDSSSTWRGAASRSQSG